jgi:hypothetical protein
MQDSPKDAKRPDITAWISGIYSSRHSSSLRTCSDVVSHSERIRELAFEPAYSLTVALSASEATTIILLVEEIVKSPE